MPRRSLKWLTVLTVLVTVGAVFTLFFYGPQAHGNVHAPAVAERN
jgi:hypothetical protein